MSTEPRTLVHLHGDCLRAILDLVDGCSLGRLFLSGNGSMMNKMRHVVRRFKSIYALQNRHSWPTLVSCFSALESFHLYTSSNNSVSGVDILALPPTVTSLKLMFANGLLELLEVPPRDFVGRTFASSLRLDVATRFSNLVELEWMHGYQKETQQWDFSNFLRTVFSWPQPLLIPNLQLDLLKYDWNDTRQLQPTTPSLLICLQDVSSSKSTSPLIPSRITPIIPARQASLFSSEPSFLTLPSSVTSLTVERHGGIFPQGILRQVQCEGGVNLSLQTLFFDEGDWIMNQPPLRDDIAPIANFRSLTSLSFKVKTCDEALMRLLPAPLRSLRLEAHDLKQEALMYPLPSELVSLDLTWQQWGNVRSRAQIAPLLTLTPSSSASFTARQEDLFPSIREDFVLKLPQTLTVMSKQLFNLVRPHSWDALPKGITRLTPEFGSCAVHLGPAQRDFIGSLPPLLSHFSLNTLALPADIEALPSVCLGRRFCSSLRLDPPPLHSAPPEPTSDATSSGEHSRQHYRLIASAIAKKFYHIEELELRVSASTFDLEHFHDLGTVSIRHMTYSEQSSVQSDESNAGTETPKCFRQLESLLLENTPVWLSPQILSSLHNLTSLQWRRTSRHIYTDKNVATTANNPGVFPSHLLAHLPPNLKELHVHLDHLDGKMFSLLPRRLEHFSLFETVPADYNLEDLLHLPRTLQFIELPKSSNSWGPETTEAALNSFVQTLPVGASFRIGSRFGFASSVLHVHRAPMEPSFQGQLEICRQNRSPIDQSTRV